MNSPADPARDPVAPVPEKPMAAPPRRAAGVFDRIKRYAKLISRDPLATGSAVLGAAVAVTTFGLTPVALFQTTAFLGGGMLGALQKVREPLVKYHRRSHPKFQDPDSIRDPAGLQRELDKPRGLLERLTKIPGIQPLMFGSASLVGLGASLATGNAAGVLTSGLFFAGSAITSTSLIRTAMREAKRSVDGREQKLDTEQNRAMDLLKRLELNPLLQRWNRVPTIGWLQTQVRRFDNVIATAGVIATDPLSLAKLASGAGMGLIAMVAGGPLGVPAGIAAIGGAVVQAVSSKREEIRKIWVPAASSSAEGHALIREGQDKRPTEASIREALEFKSKTGLDRTMTALTRGAGGTLIGAAGCGLVVLGAIGNPVTMIGWGGFAIANLITARGQASDYRREQLDLARVWGPDRAPPKPEEPGDAALPEGEATDRKPRRAPRRQPRSVGQERIAAITAAGGWTRGLRQQDPMPANPQPEPSAAPLASKDPASPRAMAQRS